MISEESKSFIIGLTITLILIIVFTATCFAGSYWHKQMKYENFQETINELNDEQKCLHICGFEWHGYFENYKYCVEKCDRISERLHDGLD